MPHISRRRSNQFCDLVRMLELAAVNFCYSFRSGEKYFGSGFDQPGLSGPSGAEQEKVGYWPARCGHSSQNSLIDIDQLRDRFILTNDHGVQLRIEFQYFRAASAGLKDSGFH